MSGVRVPSDPGVGVRTVPAQRPELSSHDMQNCRQPTNKILEAPGIDPGTSRMLSERSTI